MLSIYNDLFYLTKGLVAMKLTTKKGDSLLAINCILLLALAGLIACVPPDPPTPTNTPSPSPSPSSPDPTPTPTNILSPSPSPSPSVSTSLGNDPFTPTAIFFLFDVSQSMKDLCEDQLQTMADIPHFVISFLKAYHLDKHDRRDEVQIGWLTYPQKGNGSLSPRLENLQWYSDNREWHGSLTEAVRDHEPGLDHEKSVAEVVATLTNNYPTHKKVVIVITDGFFTYNYRSDHDDVENERKYFKEELPQSLPDDLIVHLLQLPCKTEHDNLHDYDGDMGVWDLFNSRSAQTHVLLNNEFSVRGAITHLFESPTASLDHLLPAVGADGRQLNWGWIDRNTQQTSWKTPGDTYTLDLTIVGLNSHRFEFCRVESGSCQDVSVSPDLNRVLLFRGQAQQPPILPSCDRQQWQLRPPDHVNDDFVGLFWWKASSPEMRLFIVPTVIEISNQNSFEIQAHMRADPSFERCYGVRLVYQTLNGEVYAYDKKIEDLVGWEEIPYDPEELGLDPLDLYVEIYRKHPQESQDKVVARASGRVIPNYYPEFVNSQPVYEQCRRCLVTETIRIEFNFNYAAPLFYQHIADTSQMQPGIYALTSVSRNNQNETGICDGEVGGPLQTMGIWVESNENLFALDVNRVGIKEELKGKLEAWEHSPEKSSIQFVFPLSWQANCQYEKILFQWPDAIREESWQDVICYIQDVDNMRCEATVGYRVKEGYSHD